MSSNLDCRGLDMDSSAGAGEENKSVFPGQPPYKLGFDLTLGTAFRLSTKPGKAPPQREHAVKHEEIVAEPVRAFVQCALMLCNRALQPRLSVCMRTPSDTHIGLHSLIELHTTLPHTPLLAHVLTLLRTQTLTHSHSHMHTNTRTHT